MSFYKGAQPTTHERSKYWSVAELLPKAEMRDLQFRRFKEQIDYVWEKSPFYRKKWEEAGFSPAQFQSLEDTVKIPILHKDEIRASQQQNPPYGMMYIGGRGPINRVTMTSGTTGEPVLIPFTEDDYMGNFVDAAARHLWAAGVRDTDRVHAAFGFLPFIGFTGAYDACEHMIGAMVLPGGAWNSMVRLKMIEKFKITVLMGTPTYLSHMAVVAKENGIDTSKLGLRMVLTTGEPGGASVENTKLRLERDWGCPAYDFSGTQETNYMSWTCEHGISHLNEDLIYFEVLDQDTGEPVPDGTPGRLVITDLTQKTHPIIRFDTGDIIEGIDHSYVCECGRTLSRLLGFRGRVGDIIKMKGVCVSVTGIENVLRGIDECSDKYEYVAVEDDKHRDDIIVRLEPALGIEPDRYDFVRNKVANKLHEAFMINMSVEVLPPGTLPDFDMKAKRFRDLRHK